MSVETFEGTQGQSRPHARAAGDGHAVAIGSLTIAAILLAVLPVLLVAHPGGIDWPNHLARHAIAHAGESAFYVHEWRLVPNLAADLPIAALAPLIGVEAASRAVLGASIALWVLAPMVLFRALRGCWSAWPLLAAPFAWNANVTWGFENYVLGSALALLAFSAWVAWRPRGLGLLAFAAIAFGVYVAHLFAFALLALLVFGWELRDLLARLRRPVDLVARLAVLGATFLAAPAHFVWLQLSDPASHGSLTLYGGLTSRLVALLSPVLAAVKAGPVAFGLTGVLLSLLVVLLIDSRRGFDRRMAWPLVIMGLVALAAPTVASGVGFTHIRLPFVLLVLLIASMEPPEGARRAWVAMGVGAAMLVVTTGSVISEWNRTDAQIASIREGLASLPANARLIALDDPEGIRTLDISHAVAFAATDRDAFVPHLFSGGTLLWAKNGVRHLDAPQHGPVAIEKALSRWRGEAVTANRFWASWWRDYSHVLVVGRGTRIEEAGPGVTALHRGPAHTLYRLDQGYGHTARPHARKDTAR